MPATHEVTNQVPPLAGHDPIAGDAWSVVVKGHARQIEHMIEYFDADDLPLFPWHAAPKPDIVRIEPGEVTGRRFHVVEHKALGATTGAGAEASRPPD